MATPPENLVITGFMATGKTSVGQAAALLLNRPFVDTDCVIQERTGKSISTIFGEDGEAYFRAQERDLCAELAEQSGLVIATGGGTLVDPSNLERMMHTGFVVCLNASLTTIEARLSQAYNRPLAAEWRARYEQRRSAYAVIPNHIDTTDKNADGVAAEIIALWQR